MFEPGTVELAVGDQVRATKNIGACKNNQLYRVVEISNGHIGLVPCRGGEKQVRVSTDRAMHIDQGIAVTSHASQGKTVDQVIASAPVSSFAHVNQAQFYVSMSRARQAMHLFTDGKDALREAVCRTAERLSPSEISVDRERKREKNRGVVVSKEVDLQPGARKRAVEAFEKEQINQQSKEDGWRGDWARSVKLICP